MEGREAKQDGWTQNPNCGSRCSTSWYERCRTTTAGRREILRRCRNWCGKAQGHPPMCCVEHVCGPCQRVLQQEECMETILQQRFRATVLWRAAEADEHVRQNKVRRLERDLTYERARMQVLINRHLSKPLPTPSGRPFKNFRETSPAWNSHLNRMVIEVANRHGLEGACR